MNQQFHDESRSGRTVFLEYRDDNRLIRPRTRYVDPENEEFAR